MGQNSEWSYKPERLNVKRGQEADQDGGNTREKAARVFDNVLNNRATEAQRNCVIANSAFAIQVIEPDKKIEECIAIATESLDSGRARRTLEKFIEINQ